MKKKILLASFLITIVLQFAVAQGAEQEATFLAANEYFSNKKYDEAIQQYESILATGFQSPELYFNLGNSFFQKKQWGKAILNYERAKLLAPNDKTITNNLQLANNNTIDEIEKIPTFFLARWWNQIRNLTHSGIWSILAIVLLWAAVGGLIMWILGKNRSQRKRGFVAGFVGLALSVVVFSLAYSSYQNQKNSQTAIVMSKEIPLKSLPDGLSKEVRLLHEGTKISILEKITSWYKVRLENGEIGWVMERNVEEV